jgi:hypothetical protein
MSADLVSKSPEISEGGEDVPSGSSTKSNTHLHPLVIPVMKEFIIPACIKQDLSSGHSYESSSKDCPGLSLAVIVAWTYGHLGRVTLETHEHDLIKSRSTTPTATPRRCVITCLHRV